jgi:cell division protein FtsW (lipid II flippase)
MMGIIKKWAKEQHGLNVSLMMYKKGVGKMEHKKQVLTWTILSAILYIVMIIVSSISPLSKMGENANTFNSVGMWTSIGMVVFFYVLFCLPYFLGMEFMKYVMTVCCAIGLMSFIGVVGISVVLLFVKSISLSIIILMIICVVGIIVNIKWFHEAYKNHH